MRIRKIIQLKSELKQLLREPLLALLLLLPLIMPYLILGISHFVTPYVLGYLGFNLMDYHQYIFYTICVITPGLLGIVIGFRMLDDKDEGISELMSITPAGQRGYLYNRLGFISALSIIYTFYIYLLWPYKIISIPQLVLVSLPLAGYGLILGSVLFIIAPDKVKGLTYAKVLNLLLIFGFSELIPVQGIKFVGYGMPTYWLFKILTDPTPYNLVIAYTMHLFWLVLIKTIYSNKKLLS